MFDTVSSKNKKHAYVKSRVAVLDSKCRQVGTLERGTTINYIKQKGKFIQFNYYGKHRYLKTDSLVLNKDIKAFIKGHQSLFNSKIKINKNAKIYRSSKGNLLYKASKGEEFKVYSHINGWYKVQVDGTFGWVPDSYVTHTLYVDVLEFPKIVGSSKGARVVNYAKKFLGNPYVWGGTSLTSGCDCSGFVQQVYRNFGYNLPRGSWQQATCGKPIQFSELKQGDLIFYKRGNRIGHVTMYIGNGKCIQARGAKYGIVITNYDYSKPAWARRII